MYIIGDIIKASCHCTVPLKGDIKESFRKSAMALGFPMKRRFLHGKMPYLRGASGLNIPYFVILIMRAGQAPGLTSATGYFSCRKGPLRYQVDAHCDVPQLVHISGNVGKQLRDKLTKNFKSYRALFQSLIVVKGIGHRYGPIPRLVCASSILKDPQRDLYFVGSLVPLEPTGISHQFRIILLLPYANPEHVKYERQARRFLRSLVSDDV